jgi:hypothetical protein
MILNKEAIDAYETLVSNPAKYDLEFRPFKECFQHCDKVTAKHILAKQYMDYMRSCGAEMPKLVCYIIMDNVFGPCNGKDEQGLLGYHLSFVSL